MNDHPKITGTLDSVEGGDPMCLEPVAVLMLSGLNKLQVVSILGINRATVPAVQRDWIELVLVGKYANLRIMDAGGNTLWHGLADQACAQPQFDAWLQAKCPAVLEPRTRLERLRGALFGS
jgi:hypothetical protein